MRRLAVLAFLILPIGAFAQTDETSQPPMTLSRMAELVFALDTDAVNQGGNFQLTIDDVPVMIVADPRADRMRAMVPIRSARGLDAEELMRLMQANFDSALDARYAVANGRLWSVFIHPFAPLEPAQFVSGLAQTVTAARTYGTLYSSGAGQFGGGDSGDLQRDLLGRLLDQGEDI